MIKSFIRNRWHVILLFLTPFVCALVVLLFTGHGADFSVLCPVWNDEVGWWIQVDAVKDYGMPLGYSGYNATHAQIGTFGPWPATTFFPYALFGKVFGWDLHSMALANMFFLGLSLMLFALITKGSIKQTIWMTAMYICCFITVGYSLTSMSEGIRFSLGLLLTGLVVYYERKTRDGKKLINYKSDIIILIVSVLFILYAVNVYLIYALFIPVFCMLFLRGQKGWIKGFAAGISTIVVAALEQMILTKICAPYMTSTLGKYMEVLTDQGLFGMLKYIVKNTFENLQTINLPVLIQGRDYTLTIYFIIYIVATVLAVVSCLKKPTYYNNLRAYLLLGLLIGYCVMYTGSGWTLCRGTNAAFFVSVMLLCIPEQKENQNIRAWMIGLYVISSIQITQYYTAMMNERESIAEMRGRIISEKQVLTEIMDISPEKSRWDNTIAYYGPCDYRYLSIPAGAGLNWMSNEGVSQKAGYIAIGTGFEKEEEYREMNLRSGYREVHHDDLFIILEREGNDQLNDIEE